MSEDVIQIPLPVFARVLARWYESEPTKSVSAAIVVDTWQLLKEALPELDQHDYWSAIDAARKAEREFWEQWRADVRARMAERGVTFQDPQAIGASEAPGEGS